MADCARYRDLLSGFADNALTEAENTEISEHLKGCAPCRALLTVYRDITRAAEESMAEPPEDFAAGVMGKIRALGNDSAGGDGIRALPGNGTAAGRAKTTKTYKPVIISFAAAAACLALVFLVSPQLFQFTGSNKTASVAAAPEASAAPLEYSLQAPAAEVQMDAAMKAADSGPGQEGAATEETAQPQDAGSAPESVTGTAESPPVTAPAPSPVTGYGLTAQADAWALADYYAVITISGPLPEFIASNARTANSNGTFNIEVTYEDASWFASNGYTVQFGNPEKTTALIVYTP